MRTLTIATLILVCSVLAATASPVQFNFTSPVGDEASPHTFTVGAFSLVATGYSSNNTTTDLFGKNGLGDEHGLGLKGYADNEINTGTDFIQIDTAGISSLTGLTFFMESTTDGESWKLYGSNTAGTRGSTSLATGSDEGMSHSLNLSGFRYVDFTATSGNVLLGQIAGNASGVPEPGSVYMMIGSLAIGAAYVFAKRKQK